MAKPTTNLDADLITPDPDGNGDGSGGDSTTQTQSTQGTGTNGQPKNGTNSTDGEWQKRAAGWQRQFEEQRKLFESTKGQLDVVAAAHEKSVADLAAEKAAKETATAEATAKATKLARAEMIMNDFPGLMSFYKDGLLPDGTGDELRQKLTAFQNRVNEMAGQQKKQNTGETPPAPASTNDNGKSSSAGVFKEATAALMGGDAKKYNELMDKYYQLKKDGK